MIENEDYVPLRRDPGFDCLVGRGNSTYNTASERDRCYTRRVMRRSFSLLLCFAVVVLAFITLGAGRLSAQDATTPLTVATPEGITTNDVNVVARELWCPLCNGVRLDVCELKACAQMRDLIAIKLGEGQSSQQIQEYFIDQYGPQVLGRPPFEGFSWLAWVLPLLVLLGGGALLLLRMRRMVEPQAAAVTMLDAGDETLQDAPDDDLHVRWLEDELKTHE